MPHPDPVGVIARIASEFDVLAIQRVRSTDPTLMRRLVDRINTQFNAQYDYVLSPEVGAGADKEQFAFVFDRQTVVLDVANRYAIADPENLIEYEPFVGWFRARRPDSEQAFTFTLVNLRIPSDRIHNEIPHLESVFRAVRNDGRWEDDVILLGDFSADDQLLGSYDLPLRQAVVGHKTDVQSQKQTDQILFAPTATVEFSGRSGVFDFLRHYNLSGMRPSVCLTTFLCGRSFRPLRGKRARQARSVNLR